jgi:outer membrane protein, heavy metal efflux system
MRSYRRLSWSLGLLLLGGCCFSSNQRIDKEVEELSGLVKNVGANPVLDASPLAAARSTASPIPTVIPPVNAPLGSPAMIAPRSAREACSSGELGEGLRPVTFQQPSKAALPRQDLDVPEELPGAKEAPLILPEDKEERLNVLRKRFPTVQPVPPLPKPAPGPEGRPITLADLQRFAATYSPGIKSAQAAVDAASGAVVQAGAYPNPSVFFEQDTVETGPAGYQGFGFNQVIKTGNKLKLAQAAAMMDFLNAKVALRRAYLDAANQVRGNYFAVLVAEENVKINDALYRFTDELYRQQVALLEGGFAATYEPMQLLTLLLQARINLIQAQNQYLGSWRQLAANIGLRDMGPAELEGRVDMPVPVFEFLTVRDHALRDHTDVLSAMNSLQKARFNLDLAKLTPVPDVTINLIVQKDTSTFPNQIAHSLQVAVPVPIFDCNTGNIRQADAQLVQAMAGPDQARNTLVTTLADAFNRYETARVTVQLGFEQIRNQLQAYRGIHARRQQQPDQVAFGDVVTAQQTLASTIAAYVTALGQQWQAVVDVANVLQTDDLFQGGTPEEVGPVPDLKRLTPDALQTCPSSPEQRVSHADREKSETVAVEEVRP